MSEHGYSMYTNHGCRCAECRAANTAYHTDYCYRTGRHRPYAQYRFVQAAPWIDQRPVGRT